MNGANRGNGGAPGAGEFLAVGGVATAVLVPLLYAAAYVYVAFWPITIPLTVALVVWHYYGSSIAESWAWVTETWKHAVLFAANVIEPPVAFFGIMLADGFGLSRGAAGNVVLSTFGNRA